MSEEEETKRREHPPQKKGEKEGRDQLVASIITIPRSGEKRGGPPLHPLSRKEGEEGMDFPPPGPSSILSITEKEEHRPH